jgi:hypothetical protein
MLATRSGRGISRSFLLVRPGGRLHFVGFVVVECWAEAHRYETRGRNRGG